MIIQKWFRPVRGVASRAGRGVRSIPRLARGIGRAAVGQQRRTLIVLAAAVAVLGAATGALWHAAARYDATEQAKAQALTVAKDRIVSLLSYNYRSIDRQIADNRDALTGKFRDDYVNLISTVVAPAARRQQVSIQTAVVNESVISAEPDQVAVLIYLNQQSQGTVQQSPILTGSRVRLNLVHQDDKWLISELTPL